MRSLIVGLSVGSLALAGACATATNGARVNDRLNETPVPEAPVTRADVDSMIAQGVADREGPRVSVRAEVMNVSTARRLRASFRIEDDAYVMVGHVDADGNVRIVFPTDPKDDGFVKGGGRSYETNEFFAGFEDEYRFRYNTYGRFAALQQNSYDAAQGYLFIVASWRPMHFDRVSTNGSWDSFETTTTSSYEIKPAIQELAALVAGVNREAYSLEFANYHNTMGFGLGNSFSSGFGLNYCGAYGFGFGWSSVINRQMVAPALLTSASSDYFWYRGQEYVYDGLGDCAIPLGYGYGYSLVNYGARYNGFSGFNGFTGYRPTPPAPPKTHIISATDGHRDPMTPRPVTRVHFTPDNAGHGSEGLPGRVSGEYRQRGLLTSDDPTPGRDNGRVGLSPAERHTRPSIQQMTQGRGESDGSNGTSGNNSGWSRAHAASNGANGRNGNGDNPNPSDFRGRLRDANGTGNSASNGSNNNGQNTNQGQPQRYAHPTPSDNGTGSRPTPVRADAPRITPETRSAEPRTATPAPAPVTPPAPPASSSTPPTSPSTQRPPV